MQSTLVVTVEAIDEADGTVTIKAANGTTTTVKARNPENLKQLKAGDQLVIVPVPGHRDIAAKGVGGWHPLV